MTPIPRAAAAIRVLELVGTERDAYLREAGGCGAEHGARTSVRHDDGGTLEHEALIDVVGHRHVRRHRQVRRQPGRTRRHQRVGVETTEGLEERRPRGERTELGAERGVDQRARPSERAERAGIGRARKNRASTRSG